METIIEKTHFSALITLTELLKVLSLQNKKENKKLHKNLFHVAADKLYRPQTLNETSVFTVYMTLDTCMYSTHSYADKKRAICQFSF